VGLGQRAYGTSENIGQRVCERAERIVRLRGLGTGLRGQLGENRGHDLAVPRLRQPALNAWLDRLAKLALESRTGPRCAEAAFEFGADAAFHAPRVAFQSRVGAGRAGATRQGYGGLKACSVSGVARRTMDHSRSPALRYIASPPVGSMDTGLVVSRFESGARHA